MYHNILHVQCFLTLLIVPYVQFHSLVEYYIHVYMRSDGLCGCVTCDAEYPARVAFSVLTKTLEDFDVQNPNWKQGITHEVYCTKHK